MNVSTAFFCFNFDFYEHMNYTYCKYYSISMAKYLLRQQALALRKSGKSYGQIRSEIGVSKSTLSVWLKDYPLSKVEIDLLRGRSEVRIEKFRNTMLAKRRRRLDDLYASKKDSFVGFSKKELFVAGLFLYWGEGGKDFKRPLSVHNTNPAIVKFVLFWYVTVLNVPKNKIKAYLHLYSDMDIVKEVNYWANELNLPLSQFVKPYIKKSKRSDIDHKGGFGHGTCGLIVANLRLKEEIMIDLQIIADYYGRKNLK